MHRCWLGVDKHSWRLKGEVVRRNSRCARSSSSKGYSGIFCYILLLQLSLLKGSDMWSNKTRDMFHEETSSKDPLRQ